MKVNIQNVAAFIISCHMLNASVVLADEEKVPEKVVQEVIEAEEKKPEKEQTEEGEASGNVEDCEQLVDSGDAQDGVDKKNLDKCDAMIK